MSFTLPRFILLTGFMGAGKTSIGRALATLTHRQFIDLDEEISQRQGLSVSQIFAQLGESDFRTMESKALAELLTQEGKFVIALGGGALMRQENLDLALRSGLLVYLQLPAEVLAERLQAEKASRPLLAEVPASELSMRIQHLLDEREHRYKQAHVMVSALNLQAELLHQILLAGPQQNNT